MHIYLKVSLFLKKSYPFFYNSRRINITMALLASFIVFHTMYITKPIIIYSKISTSYTVASFVYSFITFSTCILYTEVPPRFFLFWFEKWDILKEFLLAFSCIMTMGILNYIYILTLGQPIFNLNNFDLTVMCEVTFFTILCGTIPFIIISLFNFLRFERKKKYSLPLSQSAESVSIVTETTQLKTTLIVNEGNEVFKLDLMEVSFIESMGNYIKIYQNWNQTNDVLIKRITMKRMEELLDGQQILIRAHRSYFINISHIERIHKSCSGDLGLICHNSKIIVPVSRSRRKYFRNLLPQECIH